MSTETTSAIERARKAAYEASPYQYSPPSNPMGDSGMAAALAAAIDVECHEEVQGWTEDASHPCGQPAVAYREDKSEGGGSPYPVCAKHATPDLVPLTIAILGTDS